MQTPEVLSHHVKEDVCHTRPRYREGRKKKGVKVYTCSQESKYLLVTNIPSVGAHLELVKLFQVYGNVLEYKMIDEYECDEYCETMLIKFEKIQNARVSKIKLDDYNFYGGSLHVFYAPEYESVEELREKLNERRFIVNLKCTQYNKMNFGTLNYDLMSHKSVFKNVNKSKINNLNKNKFKNNEEKVSEYYDNPKLPEGWTKDTITGNESYDQTVKAIRTQLKSTVPHQLETYEERQIKKKKKIKL